MKAGRSHPAAERLSQHAAVDQLCHARVRKRQDHRREYEQVLSLLTEAFRAAPPVADPVAKPRDITQTRRAHAGVFEEQDAIAARRERAHDLLVTLPDEIPVD